MEPQSARFIIVGAGIAGIQAALNLASMGQEFILLEAQGRVGGRICTLTIGQALKEDGVEWEGWLDAVADVPVEVGATWACEDNKCIRQLVDKYKIVLDAQYYDGNHILALSPQQRLQMEDYSCYYKQHRAVILPLIERMQSLAARYEQLITLKKNSSANEKEQLQLLQFYQKYDKITGYEFILEGLKDPFLADLIDNEILTLQSISSKHFSALEFLTDDAGWHGVYHYLGIDPDNIDGFRARPGFQALVNAMLQDTLATLKSKGLQHTKEHRLRFSHPVKEIRNEETPVKVICQNGQVFTCQKVITALPSGTMGRITFGALSEGKKMILQNQLNSQTIRMTMVFPLPFWRSLHFSGNVNFSHLFPMNEIVELTPQDQSCGILALVFFKQGYQQWREEVLQQCEGLSGEVLKKKAYQVNKAKCLRILADLYLQGDIEHPCLDKCAIFTRSLSDSPYIRDTYDSTTAPSVFLSLHKKNLDHLDPYTCDQSNIIVLGSDFSEVEEGSGYMQGAVSIANRKINSSTLLGNQQ